MRRFVNLAAFVLLFAFAAFQPVRACDFFAFSDVKSRYIYSDSGVVGSKNPVVQTGLSTTCAHWSFDLWNSSELSGKGKYGRRGGGDENDFALIYRNSIETVLGKFNYAASVAYWALGYGKAGLYGVRDDMTYNYVEVSRPFKIGDATIEPFVRPSLYQPFNGKGEWVVWGGAKIELPINNWLSLVGNVSVAYSATKHVAVFRPGGEFNAKLGGGWGVHAGVGYWNDAGTVWYGGASKAF